MTASDFTFKNSSQGSFQLNVKKHITPKTKQGSAYSSYSSAINPLSNYLYLTMETTRSNSRVGRLLSAAIQAETILFMAECFVIPAANGLLEYKRRENHLPEGRKGWFRLALLGLVLWIIESAAVSKNEEGPAQERYVDKKIDAYTGKTPPLTCPVATDSRTTVQPMLTLRRCRRRHGLV